MMEQHELTKLFGKLGARNPEGWARSQIEESINQLGRFLFLRQAWRLVLSPDDTNWIDQCKKIDKGPGGEIGPALNRLLALGVNARDLTAVARVMQWQLLFGICYLLDDPGDIEDEVKDVAWGLFQVDEDGRPIAPIGSVHESVLETEPTGREMRPPGEAL